MVGATAVGAGVAGGAVAGGAVVGGTVAGAAVVGAAVVGAREVGEPVSTVVLDGAPVVVTAVLVNELASLLGELASLLQAAVTSSTTAESNIIRRLMASLWHVLPTGPGYRYSTLVTSVLVG